MTYQRTRGPLVTFYPRKEYTSERGVTKWGADRENPQQVRVAFTADRMSKAEAMGQVEIELYVARFPWETEGVGPGALIVWDGSEWDCTGPAALHDTLHHSTRHQTVAVRRRPGGVRS